MPFNVANNLVQAGPGSSAASLYEIFSPLDSSVMERMGTSAAAVPAARTSEKEESSV